MYCIVEEIKYFSWEMLLPQLSPDVYRSQDIESKKGWIFPLIWSTPMNYEDTYCLISLGEGALHTCSVRVPTVLFRNLPVLYQDNMYGVRFFVE